MDSTDKNHFPVRLSWKYQVTSILSFAGHIRLYPDYSTLQHKWVDLAPFQ